MCEKSAHFTRKSIDFIFYFGIIKLIFYLQGAYFEFTAFTQKIGLFQSDIKNLPPPILILHKHNAGNMLGEGVAHRFSAFVFCTYRNLIVGYFRFLT